MERIVTLADLRPDKKNPRKHSARNVGMIEASLRQVGAARSGVIDENQVILAGNGTYEALAAAGIEKVKVVEADGNEWVVVQRRGLTEEQKRILSISDNRAGDLATWDGPTLKAQGIDLKPWFYEQELEKLTEEKKGNFPGQDQSNQLQESFSVLILCSSEEQQGQLLQRLTEEGYTCRSLIS